MRDEQRVLSEALPPLLQFMQHHVGKLRSGTPEEQAKAVVALGEAGDAIVLADLAACLADAALQELVQDAMWAIFMRSKDPKVNELMVQGCNHMQSAMGFPRALSTFEDIIKLAPMYAEGYNKRATIYYLMGRYEESIEDCKTVLQLQPYHFAAASGMGLCYLQLRKEAEALRSFEEALAIHPAMGNIVRLVHELRQRVKDQSSPSS